MSERLQGTAKAMREKMLNRYDDGLPHKHDKNHIPYRQHYRTHPVQPTFTGPGSTVALDNINHSTGELRLRKLRKYRNRLGKSFVH